MQQPAHEQTDDLWLVLPHLGPGGAQKVALLAAGFFLDKGWRVRLVTMLPGPAKAHAIPEGLLVTDLAPAVDALWRRDHWNRSWLARSRRFLAPKRRLHRLLARLVMGPLVDVLEPVQPGKRCWRSRLLRWCVNGIDGPPSWELERLLQLHCPTRVVSFLSRTNMRICSALWWRDCHLVVSERNDLRKQELPFPWPVFRRLLYRRADVLTANTIGVMDSLEPLFQSRRLALLPNPLPMPVVPASVGTARDRQGFVTVARLVPQKGIDVLIGALAQTTGPACGWMQTLVGDGPEREALELQVRQAGLQKRVRFLGFRPDPQTFLLQASVFVLPSRFEGMPNALLEAMAAGLAVVVTDASPGPLEVVKHGVSGLIVPSDNPSALAAALDQLAADPGLRERLGTAARETLRGLDWPVVGPIWESLVDQP
jgi:glycosyltransferase involved in cell wall biosynthesis